MKPLRYTLPLAVATLAITLPARTCSPDFPDAIFVLQDGPGGSYAAYVAGRLGVPQADYRTRHLVVAYDYLTQRSLSADEQKQAIAVNDQFLNPWDYEDAQKKTAPPKGFDRWSYARNVVGLKDSDQPSGQLSVSRSIPGDDYGSFENCLDPAFAAAADTLHARVASYTVKDPNVIEWVRGQDAVFSNCGDGKSAPYYGSGNPPTPPPPPHPPADLPASAPRWLQQDRAYQFAAADFYALHYDSALTRFRAIATDTSSPWSITARYLVARTYIRKASFSNGPSQNQQQQAQGGRDYDANLKLAQHELIAMQSEPRMASMRNAVSSLLDYVNIRIEPEKQATVLADRLHAHNTPRFGQALIDLTWLRTDHNEPSKPAPALGSNPPTNDMLAWVDAVSTSDEKTALTHWHATPNSAWLLAAISFAQPTDSATPALLKAAQVLPKTDPAWTAVTYHRLRLLPLDASTRTQVLGLLPQIQKSETSSTVNLFLALDAATAPSLDAWLSVAAARKPAGDTSETSGEESLPAQPDTSAATQDTSTPIEDACGNKVNTVLSLFDTDAAVTLNRDMPLRLLALAAESSTLPENLRFQVAQATWARAVLLDKPEIAHRMTPILIACRAAWKPVLTAYDAATTPDQRHATGLLALMRFASTEPSVREGEERRNGFATYDELRQNWWCSTVPKPGNTVDYEPEPPTSGNAGPAAKVVALTPPPFLTQADLTEAHTEVTALEKIPRASTYFAQQALAWTKLHPKDPQTPDILGEADRALRNACRKEPPYDDHGKQHTDPTDMTLTPNLAKALFDVLHRDYPNSTWARRYTSWE